MKPGRKDISIKTIITIMFVLTLAISISAIGHLVFARWINCAKNMAEGISRDINAGIYEKIYAFMRVPDQINEANQKNIESHVLDLADEVLREKYFVGVLSSQVDEIYSVSYGTALGEYYGARRNAQGAIEIMRNNSSTGGNSWYYTVTEDLTAGELAVDAGQFDPRTRNWYAAAVDARGPTFSPLYKHFVMDDLTVSVSRPVYDGMGGIQGVAGTHMLLAEVGALLEDAVKGYHGDAFIVERDSGALIANSMGADNFTVLPDGSLKRHRLQDVENSDLKDLYGEYEARSERNFVFAGEGEKYHINVRDLDVKGVRGLNWVVMSAIPESLYMSQVKASLIQTLLLILLAIGVSLAIYYKVTSRLFMPIEDLLSVSNALSSGDLESRVEIVRADEIGDISHSLNKVADKMHYLINHLEANVRERTEELEESKNNLQLILDSAAEGIYGVDLAGICTFCNTRSVELLGYSSPEDLMGKYIHRHVHPQCKDETEHPFDECKIFKSMRYGKEFGADDEVFWRADGTFFYVQYHSHPQIRDGRIVGAVVTFFDITDRRKREEEIRYLSCHDMLTGLYNRSCFEKKRVEIDVAENLPLSVIFADINGLKMTNDIFGHSSGDRLIKKSAEILTRSCRDQDLVSRVGGDEFIILMPNTEKQEAQEVLSKIKAGFLDAYVEAIKCSISLGSDIKVEEGQSLEEVLANAENAMYRDKIMNRKSINADIIDTIVKTLHSRSTRERQHSTAVSILAEEMGKALDLPGPDVDKLKRAGYLHDIGKIILDEDLLAKESLTEEEYEKMQQHPAVGYRILNLFDDTLDLAEYVYGHHERWDGTGYPRGLKEKQIPLISRIISVAETYDRVLHRNEGRGEVDALKVIRENAGTQFDPEIAHLFVRIMQDRPPGGGGAD